MASGMDKGKAVERFSSSPQAPDVGHHQQDNVPHPPFDALQQQLRDRQNYGDTPYAHELAQAGSSRQEHQASPLDHGDAGEQSSVPMGQRRFLPTGSAVEVRGWTAYTSAAQEESAMQRTTDAGQERGRQQNRKVDVIRLTSPGSYTTRDLHPEDSEKGQRIRMGDGVNYLLRSQENLRVGYDKSVRPRKERLTSSMAKKSITAILKGEKSSYTTTNGWKFEAIYVDQAEQVNKSSSTFDPIRDIK